MSEVITPWVVPGAAALAVGRVVHHRSTPSEHRFSYPMTQVWVDPDHPDELCDTHRLWSHRHPAPARFRTADYHDGQPSGLGSRVRRHLGAGLGRPVDGPIRMLTQPRIWGWLFNPITIYLAWDRPERDDPDATVGRPAAALLEVTNTPWKERHWYPLPLRPAGDDLVAGFAKELHVSPFLDLDRTYCLRLHRRDHSMLDLTLDVHPQGPSGHHPVPGPGAGTEAPVLHTRLTTRLHRVDESGTRALMGAVLRPDRLPTHRVSVGIHRQALALWRRGVPFVPHPSRRR